MKPVRLCAFADEAGTEVAVQIAALKENGIPCLEIRGIEGKNVTELSLAQALIRSGYKPQKTLVFIAFAAEEWGKINSRYDWSAGAYAEMTQGQNDWRGRNRTRHGERLGSI